MASISFKRELPAEFLGDIMVTAFDGQYGGCWYWASPNTRDGEWLIVNDEGAKASDQIWLEARIQDNEDPDEQWMVNHDVLAKGIERILDGTVEVGRELLGSISQAVQDTDNADIDALGADLIVQAGLFSEQVYA